MQKTIHCKQFPFDSDEYKQSLLLRDEILRKPLGLCLFEQDLREEKNYFHLGAFIDKRLVGAALLIFNDKSVRIAQVAVAANHQKSGVGKKLMLFAEDIAKAQQLYTAFVHAREKVVPFYQQLGYQYEDRPFVEVGLIHYLMYKNLN